MGAHSRCAMKAPMLQVVAAHCRPQPAIPAVFVLLLTWFLTRLALGSPEPGALATWGIPLGLVASAGLALAAGFCSFFPPIAWLGLVWLGSVVTNGPVTGTRSIALWIGTALAVAALGIQAWRVASGRFTPTIESGAG